MTEDIRNKIVSVSTIDKPGDYVLSLFDIDTDFYPNPRGTEEWEAIKEMMNSLEMNDKGQQLQNIVCTIEIKDDGLVVAAVNAGYTRAEAAKRNALNNVISQWNSENKLTKSHADYIDPSCTGKTKAEANKDYNKLVQVGGRWKEAYESALKSYPLRVNIRAIHGKDKSDPREARIVGFEENFRRTDMSLNAIVENIAWLSSEEGGKMKGKDIAKKFDVSPAMVSQWLSVFNIENVVREFAEYAKANDDQKALMEVCIKEFKRRSSLPTKDPCAIIQSHARDFAIFVKDYKKSKLKFASVLKILCALTCVNETTQQPNTNAQRVDLSIFRMQIEAVKNESTISQGGITGSSIKTTNIIEQAVSDQLTAKELVEQAGEDDQFNLIATKLGLTTESLIKSVEKEVENTKDIRSTRSTPDEDISDDVFRRIAEEATAAAKESSDKLDAIRTGVDTEIESESDGIEGVDEVNIDNVSLESIEGLGLDSIMKDSVDGELDEDEDEDEIADIEKIITGEKSTKRTDVSEKVLSVKSIGSLMAKARELIVLIDTIDVKDGYQFIEMLCTLCDLVATYDAMGDNTKKIKINEAYLNYMDKTHKLLFGLIEFARKNMNADEFKSIESSFPVLDKTILE